MDDHRIEKSAEEPDAITEILYSPQLRTSLRKEQTLGADVVAEAIGPLGDVARRTDGLRYLSPNPWVNPLPTGEAKLAKDLRRSCTDLSRNAIKARYGLKERVREALPEKSFSAGDLRALVTKRPPEALLDARAADRALLRLRVDRAVPTEVVKVGRARLEVAALLSGLGEHSQALAQAELCLSEAGPALAAALDRTSDFPEQGAVVELVCLAYVNAAAELEAVYPEGHAHILPYLRRGQHIAREVLGAEHTITGVLTKSLEDAIRPRWPVVDIPRDPITGELEFSSSALKKKSMQESMLQGFPLDASTGMERMQRSSILSYASERTEEVERAAKRRKEAAQAAQNRDREKSSNRRNKHRDEMAKQKINAFTSFVDDTNVLAAKREYLYKNDTYIANRKNEFNNEGRYLQQIEKQMNVDDLCHLRNQCSTYAHNLFKEEYAKKKIVFEDVNVVQKSKKKGGKEAPDSTLAVRKMQKDLVSGGTDGRMKGGLATVGMATIVRKTEDERPEGWSEGFSRRRRGKTGVAVVPDELAEPAGPAGQGVGEVKWQAKFYVTYIASDDGSTTSPGPRMRNEARNDLFRQETQKEKAPAVARQASRKDVPTVIIRPPSVEKSRLL